MVKRLGSYIINISVICAAVFIFFRDQIPTIQLTPITQDEVSVLIMFAMVLLEFGVLGGILFGITRSSNKKDDGETNIDSRSIP